MEYGQPYTLLNEYATFHNGICTGDYERFGRRFYEVPIDGRWIFQQSTTTETDNYKGCSNILLWEAGNGDLVRFVTERLGEKNVGSWIRGQDVWGLPGVIITPTGQIRGSLYAGTSFDNNSIVLTTYDKEDLPAMWAYVSSSDYHKQVRLISKALKVQGDLIKVPFNRAYYRELAATTYMNGLPEPYSADPTQWLFHGHPAQTRTSTALQVALARLCGYCWPAETDKNLRLSREARDWIAKTVTLPMCDDDGLLPCPAVAGERPLIERLRGYLAAAFGTEWSDRLERRLVAEADEVLDKRSARDGSLEAWLRDRAFRQHCALFHQRPFLWHVWDGQPDGFAAFLHYHRLSRANLERLTFSLLGDWIARMRDAGDGRRLEAALILQEKLQAILKGESPLDIFVRWKPVAAQPIGWDPDLDDGVRLNIRPFVRADVLRVSPNIHWRKSGGKDVSSTPWYNKFNGERINDHHLTIAEKEAARAETAARVA
jgi:hypothetical protein